MLRCRGTSAKFWRRGGGGLEILFVDVRCTTSFKSVGMMPLMNLLGFDQTIKGGEGKKGGKAEEGGFSGNWGVSGKKAEKGG